MVDNLNLKIFDSIHFVDYYTPIFI